MAKVEVILTQNIVGLGAETDHVKVAAGYARNYLFPQRLAIPQTAANKRRLDVMRQRRAERESHELNTMSELGRSLSKMQLTLTVKTGDDGKMFGSVTAGTIADELKHQFDVGLDRKKIHLTSPIRSTGEHEIELRLHPEVRATLKVLVKTATPPPELTASAASAKGASIGKSGVAGKPDADRQGRGDRSGPRHDRRPRASTPEKKPA